MDNGYIIINCPQVQNYLNPSLSVNIFAIYYRSIDANGMNNHRTYQGTEEAVWFRMVSVDLALMKIDEIQAAGQRVPVRAFSEF